MNEQLVKTVFEDKEFVTSLLDLETPEEVQAAVKEKGIDLSMDDIAKIRDAVIKNNGKSGDELNLEALEDVAGGIAITSIVIGVAGAVSATAVAGGFVHRVSSGRW